MKAKLVWQRSGVEAPAVTEVLNGGRTRTIHNLLCLGAASVCSCNKWIPLNTFSSMTVLFLYVMCFDYFSPIMFSDPLPLNPIFFSAHLFFYHSFDLIFLFFHYVCFPLHLIRVAC